MSSSEKRTPANQFLLAILFSVFTCFVCLWGYHNYVLRPWEAVTVDFRRLSDAKLGQLTERALAGQPTNVAELEDFIRELQENIFYASRGRIVFTSGAVLNSSVHDLTEEVAREMGLDLSKGLETSLPGMASRIGGTLSRNLDENAANQQEQAE